MDKTWECFHTNEHMIWISRMNKDPRNQVDYCLCASIHLFHRDMLLPIRGSKIILGALHSSGSHRVRAKAYNCVPTCVLVTRRSYRFQSCIHVSEYADFFRRNFIFQSVVSTLSFNFGFHHALTCPKCRYHLRVLCRVQLHRRHRAYWLTLTG